jgi:hypothetical protein
MIWVLFTPAGQNNFKTAAKARHNVDHRTAHCEASVNVSTVSPQRALVKVNADVSWVSTLSVGMQNQIERVFTKFDHADAVALVRSDEWLSEQPNASFKPHK